MRAYVERVGLYTFLSYRALFNWLRPASYVSSLIVVPAFTGMLLVVASGQGGADTVRPALGAAMMSTANAVLFGTSFATINERGFGTLWACLCAPQSLLESLLAKSAAHVVNGIITGTITFAIVARLAHVDLTVHTAGLLLLCALASAAGAGGLGVLSAAVSLRTRDSMAMPNVVRALILLASGALVDPNALFVNMGWLGPVLPVHHAVAAALDVVHGHGMRWSRLGMEIAVGATWGTAGFVLYRRALVASRRRGSLELD